VDDLQRETNLGKETDLTVARIPHKNCADKNPDPVSGPASLSEYRMVFRTV